MNRLAEATKTPRTQAAIKTYGDYIRSEDAVPIEFAEQLERELAEARAEIGRLKHQIERELEHKKKLSDCANSGMIANEKIFDQLTEARAEIERLKGELIRQIQPEEYVLSTYSTTAGPVKNAKDKLIEQMRQTLIGVLLSCDATWESKNLGHDWQYACEQMRAALEAAERGEG